MKTIGVMAAIAIAFLCVTSPGPDTVTAKPPHDAHVSQAAQLSVAFDGLDKRVTNIERSIDGKIAAEVSKQFAAIESSVVETDLSGIEARLGDLELAVADCPCPPEVQAAAPPKVITRTVTPAAVSYSPRWSNNDGLPLDVHAIQVHGFSPSLSSTELARQHDAWHDANGGDPPTSRSRSRTVTYSSPVTYSGTMSNCPGGVCPAPSVTRTRNVQSSGGLFGFGVLGRRR